VIAVNVDRGHSPAPNGKHEYNTDSMLYREAHVPQELERPEVYQEVGYGIDHSGDNVKDAFIDAVIGIDARIPVRRSWSRRLVSIGSVSRVRRKHVRALKYRYQHRADPPGIKTRDHYPAKDRISSRLEQVQVRKAN
jgi:hypothetical protein